MRLTVTTWNINSVRLRIDLVAKFIKAARPDVLCLQETKCPDDTFPLKRFKRLGYDHVALNGQKGYHGVAVVSRLPFERSTSAASAARPTAATSPSTFGARAGLRGPITLHNFYVPAGGDDSRSGAQPEIRPQARLPRRDARTRAPAAGAAERAILVGDLNVAPLEHDVWSHKQLLQRRLAHADRVREAQRGAQMPAAGSTACAPSCRSRRSSTRGGATAPPTGSRRPRPPPRPHLDLAGARRPGRRA